MEEKPVQKYVNKPLIKTKFTKEDVEPKYQFKEYILEEISDLKVIKSHTVFIIFEGKLKDMPVLLLKVRFFDIKSLNVFIKTSPIFKVRSKYMVPKVGYIIDYKNGLFYTIYERGLGKLLEFDDLYNFNITIQCDLVKLHLFNIIMKFVHNLKKTIKDKFKIGMLEPSLFLFNVHDQIPLKMIDIYFYNYFENCNRDKILDFLRPIFGQYDVMEIKTNDMTTMKILLAKIFLDDHSITYNTLIYKYYLEFNIKNNLMLQRKKTIINSGSEMDERKIFFFESIVKKIKNEKVRNFIINWEKEKIGLFGKDVKYLFDHFYEKAFLPLLKEMQREFSCFGENCNNHSTQIYPFCFEPLCDKCFESHRCKATIFQELNSIYNDFPNIEEKIANISKQITALPKINFLVINTDYKEKVFPVQRGIKRIITNTKKKILHYENYINSIIKYMESNFKSILNDKFNELDDLLEEYNYNKDEIYKKKLSNQISQCEKFIVDSKYVFDKIAKNMSVYRNIEKMYNFAIDYLEKLDLYFNDILTFTFNEIYVILYKYLSNITLSKPLIELDLMIYEEKLTDIIFPNLISNKLVRFHDIRFIEGEAQYKTTVINLSFSKKIEDKIIPKGSRYIRVKNCIFTTGGYNETTKSAIRQTFVIYLKNNKVKLRKGQMLFPRYNHSLALYNDFFIIVLGGENMNTVEMYSIMNDKWTLLPSMNNKRANSSSIVLNNRYFYVFFGEHEGKLLDTIEYFDIFKKGKWTVIKCVQNDPLSENVFSIPNCGIYQKSENVLYLIGGKVMDERDRKLETSDYVYEYDLKTNCYSLEESNIEKGYFLENVLYDLGINDYRFQVIYDDEKYKLLSFKIIS